MCSSHKSHKVSCFNVDNCNSQTCVCDTWFALAPQKQTIRLTLALAASFPPALHSLPSSLLSSLSPSTADLTHGIITELCEFHMNKSFTSISLHFTSFFLPLPLCRSLRRGRCCEFLQEGTPPSTPCPENSEEQPNVEVDAAYRISLPRLLQLWNAHVMFMSLFLPWSCTLHTKMK